MSLIKVKDNPGLFRDSISNAIVVDDPIARKNYNVQRKILESTSQTTEELKCEMIIVRQELGEIRSVLVDLLSHINKKTSN